MSEESLVKTLNSIKDQFDIIISLLARQTLDQKEIKETITKGARDKKRLITCFNLCDGKTPLTEIAKAGKMDPGNLSRQVESWENDGYVFKIRDGQKTFPKALIRIP